MTRKRQEKRPGNVAAAAYSVLRQVMKGRNKKNTEWNLTGKKQCQKTATLVMSMLQSGPRREQDVWGAVQQAGCSKRTYHRVRQLLGVEATHVGGKTVGGS